MLAVILAKFIKLINLNVNGQTLEKLFEQWSVRFMRSKRPGKSVRSGRSKRSGRSRTREGRSFMS